MLYNPTSGLENIKSQVKGLELSTTGNFCKSLSVTGSSNSKAEVPSGAVRYKTPLKTQS